MKSPTLSLRPCALNFQIEIAIARINGSETQLAIRNSGPGTVGGRFLLLLGQVVSFWFLGHTP